MKILNKEGKILSIDLGFSKVGFCSTDTNKLIPIPLKLVVFPINLNENNEKLLFLAKIIEDLNSKNFFELIIIGFATKEDGKESHMSIFSNMFAEMLKAKKFNVLLLDERHSTRMSKDLFLQKKQKTTFRESKDTYSACLLLLNYLEANK